MKSRSTSPKDALGGPLHDTPYTDNHWYMAGVYRINVGKVFLGGSAVEIGHAIANHHWMLKEGIHPSGGLQAAFAAGGEISAEVVLEVPRKVDDTDHEHRRRIKFREHLYVGQIFGTPGCANRTKDVGFHGVSVGRSAEALGAMAKKPKSPETLKKMSIAKRGGRNVNARACVLEFRGEEFRFDTGTGAADHFGVTQQTMDLWLRGIVPWPGKGKRKPRAGGRLVGLTGRYTDRR